MSTLRAVAWSPEGRRIATASDDRTACVWDSANDTKLATIHHDLAVRAVSWSPDGGRIATASNNRTGRIWNARIRAALHVMRGHDLTVRALVRSADSRRIVTASDDCAALIWDTDHGTLSQGYTITPARP